MKPLFTGITYELFKQNDYLQNITKPIQSLIANPQTAYLTKYSIGLGEMTAMHSLTEPAINPYKGHFDLMSKFKNLHETTASTIGANILFSKPIIPIDKIYNTASTLGAQISNELLLSQNPGLTAMGETVRHGLSTYVKQLDITEKFSNSFVDLANLKTPHFDFFTADNFVNEKPLNTFDLFSGGTFLRNYALSNNDNTALTNSYLEIEDLLGRNEELQKEILKLQSTAITIAAGNNDNVTRNEKWYKIKGYEDLAEWFMNKILIRKFGLSYPIANILTVLVMLSIPALCADIFFEAKGADLYNYVFQGKTVKVNNGDTVYQYIKVPNEINDFTIKRSEIYSQPSTKNRRIGYYELSTTVLIIKIKDGWCFVEGDAVIEKYNNRKNRKTYGIRNGAILVRRKVKGWVRKDCLDMFQ